MTPWCAISGQCKIHFLTSHCNWFAFQSVYFDFQMRPSAIQSLCLSMKFQNHHLISPIQFDTVNKLMKKKYSLQIYEPHRTQTEYRWRIKIRCNASFIDCPITYRIALHRIHLTPYRNCSSHDNYKLHNWNN